MRWVSVKMPAQQGILCVHGLREGVKSERTACINRIRGLLAEFGLVFPQSPKHLRAALTEVIEDASNNLPGLARLTIQQVQSHWRYLGERLAWCDQRMVVHIKEDKLAHQAIKVSGVGQVAASAVVATVIDLKQFRNGAQFGARIRLTPRQHSSAGKNNLSRIMKRGHTYLRTRLIQGAEAAVALANKNARILWHC